MSANALALQLIQGLLQKTRKESAGALARKARGVVSPPMGEEPMKEGESEEPELELLVAELGGDDGMGDESPMDSGPAGNSYAGDEEQRRRRL